MDSPIHALRTAAKSTLPPRGVLLASRRLLLAVAGFGAAAAVSLGLANGVPGGLTDPRTLPEPAPALYQAAVQDPSSASFAPSNIGESAGAAPAQGGPGDAPAAPSSPATATSTSPATATATMAATRIPNTPTTVPATSTTAPDGVTPQAQVQKPAPIFVPSTSSDAPIPTATLAPTQVPTAVPTPIPAGPGFYIPSQVNGDAGLEGALLAEINAERAAAGLPAYVSDSSLIQIARTRSQQMVDKGYFSHIDPASGQYMYTALLSWFGIGYAWAGENLALNNYSRAESPGVAITKLMGSPTHRANILAGDFSRIGVGVVVHPDGRIFYTMIFIG